MAVKPPGQVKRMKEVDETFAALRLAVRCQRCPRFKKSATFPARTLSLRPLFHFTFFLHIFDSARVASAYLLQMFETK